MSGEIPVTQVNEGTFASFNHGDEAMNWSAVGAAGELLGAIAVVASLLWVARQVQASNRIAQAEAYRTAQVKMAELMVTSCEASLLLPASSEAVRVTVYSPSMA